MADHKLPEGRKHEKLVKLANRWLANVKRCGVAIAEIVTAAGEIPDVIGWRIGVSYVVEVKVSRSDFLRDKDKCHHRADRAMGSYRYYLAPKGLLTADEMPELVGLLEVYLDGSGTSMQGTPRIKVVKEAEMRELSPEIFRREISVLQSALRRMKQREFITILETEDSHV